MKRYFEFVSPAHRWTSGKVMLMSVRTVLSRLNWHYAIILCLALAAHGLLLLNDGVYWDGWLIYTSLIEKNWNNLLWFTESGGIPTTLYFHWLLGHFPEVIFGYKLVAFVSITLSAILVYMICDELRLISRSESLFIALLSLSYPAFQVSIELINTPSVVYYCLFLLACFLTIRSEKTEGTCRYCLRVCSLALFVLSFTVNSLLVFYFGFLLVLTLHAQRERSISLRYIFTRFLPRRLDYVLLPLVYWGVTRFCFPVHGSYAGYNQFLFSPRVIVVNLIGFFNNAIYGQLNHALAEIARQPALWLFVLLTALWFYSAFRVGSARFLGGRVNSYALLACGFLLLVLGMLPYVIVGKAPSLHGWNTRHALLVALPMAVIIVAIAHLAFAEPAGSSPRPGWVFLTILILAFSLSTITNYISWQARWVKDRSIMANLVTLDNAKGISVFWVDDQFPAGGEEYYRFYEWSSMFKTVWGDESRIGLDQRMHSAEFLVNGQQWGFFNKTMNLSDFDPAGCQAILTIRRGPLSYSNTELSARYLFYKFFRNKDRLAKFLSGVTDVQVQPISAPQAVNCPVQ